MGAGVRQGIGEGEAGEAGGLDIIEPLSVCLRGTKLIPTTRWSEA